MEKKEHYYDFLQGMETFYNTLLASWHNMFSCE